MFPMGVICNRICMYVQVTGNEWCYFWKVERRRDALIDKVHHSIMASTQRYFRLFSFSHLLSLLISKQVRRHPAVEALYYVIMFLQKLIPNKTVGGCKHRAQYVPSFNYNLRTVAADLQSKTEFELFIKCHHGACCCC